MKMATVKDALAALEAARERARQEQTPATKVRTKDPRPKPGKAGKTKGGSA